MPERINAITKLDTHSESRIIRA